MLLKWCNVTPSDIQTIPTIRGEQKNWKNRLNRENQKKSNWKNRTEKKNRLIFWKNRPVRFRFYKQKNEPNRTETETDKKPEKNRAKPSQNRAKPKKTESKLKKTEPNRFEPVFALKKPNRTETGRFDPVSVRIRFFFQKKNFGLVIFFDKNRTEPKMITPTNNRIGGRAIAS